MSGLFLLYDISNKSLFHYSRFANHDSQIYLNYFLPAKALRSVS